MESNITNKIIGYFLLVLGLVLIAFPVWQTYNIIANHAQLPEILKIPSASKDNSQPANPMDFQKQIENSFAKVFPSELIGNTLNLISWVALMLILIFAGKQISYLGINLLKGQ